MATPELKQFGELEAGDFERHPVWVGCHTADYGKPWYDDTDEETFRPHTGKLPADPAKGMFLVSAKIELRDGSRHSGFVTPAAAGWDKRPNGRQMFKYNHILGSQQPQIFVGDRFFGFWGGRADIPHPAQQELYVALGKTPDAIFPLRFTADPGLAGGITDGQVDGFYRQGSDGIHVGFIPAGRVPADRDLASPTWFQVWGRGGRGYPQPERNFGYLDVVYAATCPRCRLFERQKAAFRFKKSAPPLGFTQLGWVYDAFFAPPAIVDEISKAGIRGASRGSAVFHRTGAERTDLSQVMISTVIACVETSHLSTVTCRPQNEETLAIRAMVAKQKPLLGKSSLSPELQEQFRKHREKIAALPYCGRVKYHVPTSLAVISGSLKNAPDLFQTAEWFGSGGLAFRLTLASERFVNLVRERRWKGLVFNNVKQSGQSDRGVQA